MKVQENIPTVLQDALSELKGGLQQLLGDNLIEARLFGSRARGDHEPDSDVDVMVLVKERSWDIDRGIVAIFSDIGIKYELCFVPLKMTPEQLEDQFDMNTLLYRNLISEGIVIRALQVK